MTLLGFPAGCPSLFFCRILDLFSLAVSSDGVYQQTSIYELEGFIIAAPADFFTAENKQFVEASVEVEELASGESVELHLSNKYESINDSNDSTWQLEVNAESGVGEQAVQLSRVARYVVAKVVLKTATETTSPKFKAFRVRALARPELVVVQIPVNISDRVERPYRKPIRVKNLGETIYQSLKDTINFYKVTDETGKNPFLKKNFKLSIHDEDLEYMK